MVIFRNIFILTTIFLFFHQSDAFVPTEGKEYKFKYNMTSTFFIEEDFKVTSYEKFYIANLTIRALPDNWLECHVENVMGKGVKYYYGNTYETFLVKLNGSKIDEFYSIEEVSDETYHIKKKMIEEILMDRSDIVELIKKGHNYGEIMMPFGGKCEVQLSKKITENKKEFKAKTTVPKYVDVDEKVLLEFGEPSGNSYAMITLVYDTKTNKQTELRLNNCIRIYNWNKTYLSKQRTVIQYLGSSNA